MPELDLHNKKILQISHEPGPLRCFMQPMCRRLREMGATVELACISAGANYEPLRQAGFTLHPMTPGRWKNPSHWIRMTREVRAILKRGDYDLIVVHTPAMAWIVRRAARQHRAKTIYFAHGLPFVSHQSWWRRLPMRLIEQSCGKYTEGLIVNNAEDLQAGHRYRLTRTGGNVFMVPGVGIDVDYWAQPLSKQQNDRIDEVYGLRHGVPLVLYLGRLIESKRPFEVLNLARTIGDKAEFLIAGEGPLYESLRARAAELGDHVHVRGWTEDAHDLIRRSTMAYFPSVFGEGLPVFVMECQAAGKPVVAYDVRGTCDIVVDGETGRLIAPGDVDALVASAADLLDDPARCRELGANGQQRVREEFSMQRSHDEQLRAIRAVLTGETVTS